MAGVTRRAALAALGVLGAGAMVWRGYVRPGVPGLAAPAIRLTDCGGFMGAGRTDMSRYMDMFMRHNEIHRVVEDIPGGVRTTTESASPDLAAQLQAHVSSMYAHLDQGTEVSCMSQTLPTLFRRAGGYRRQLTLTPNGVIAEETADDPALTDVIRSHAREVTGFVRDGMPAMMQQMMGPGGMGCGRMMNPRMP
ncbi:MULTISPECIES: hypothetical protein [unclassified Mycobacterium]|uniref:hypothetical protein n=1 Tax=unclassified Mycobacterium TaxID=2642494 RepID=UPI0006DC0487|nr:MULTISPECIES: hypothetical protein [unclassified Mycobacterium]